MSYLCDFIKFLSIATKNIIKILMKKVNSFQIAKSSDAGYCVTFLPVSVCYYLKEYCLNKKASARK